MAKTTGPLMSLDAWGSVGKTLTFQHSIKSHQVRIMPVPRYTKTPDQLAQRHIIKVAVSRWHILTVIQRGYWEAYADGYGYKGYHSFIKQFITKTLMFVYQYQIPPDIGWCLVDEHLVDELIIDGPWIDPTKE